MESRGESQGGAPRLLHAGVSSLVVLLCSVSGCSRADAPPAPLPRAVIASPSVDTVVEVGTAVRFSPAARDTQEDIVAHAWSFGDGAISDLEYPSPHAYAETGEYRIQYEVEADGDRSLPSIRTVTVVAAGTPRAAIDGRDTTIALGQAIDVSGSATDPDGRVVSHAWSFGDGAAFSRADPGPHVYQVPGQYRITYQVIDDAGIPSLPAVRHVSVLGENRALRFYGNAVNDIDRVKIRLDDPATDEAGPPVDVGATDFTIDFWMRALPGANPSGAVECGENVAWIYGNIIIDRDRYLQDRDYGVSLAGGRLVFGVSATGEHQRTICGATRVDDGRWHHVALTRRVAGGDLHLFVDGRLDADGMGPPGDISYPDEGVPGDHCSGPCTNSDPFLVIGAEKHDADPALYPSFNGWLDELRLSSIVRYTDDFAPPARRFETDDWTVGLYHFDADRDGTVVDSSGAIGGPSNGVAMIGGSPPGPEWVPSDAPTGGR